MLSLTELRRRCSSACLSDGEGGSVKRLACPLPTMHNRSCCPIQGDAIARVMPPLLILAFVLGALGNGLALCGFCFRMKSWKPSTVYLFNLAVADFLLMVCLPFRTDYYLRNRSWNFGDIFCSVVLFMLAMNRAGSIVFLTVVAVDRYFKVVRPHHVLNAISTRTAAGIAYALWAMVIVGTVYLLTESHLCERANTRSCESFIMESSNGWHDIMFQLEFFLPLGIISFCTLNIVWSLRRRPQLARQNRMKKATRFIVVVAVVFITCYLPSVSARLYFLWTVPFSACDGEVHVALHVTLSFTYMNSMLDPLVYYFSSPAFPKFYTNLKIGGLRSKRPGNSKMQSTEGMPQMNLGGENCRCLEGGIQGTPGPSQGLKSNSG
ncbi:hydroxycarboxylic acid receptor 1 [Ornithorhynchus anatinus]|uniref:Hydroxycarboxylic acid receptor 1 n=1 Tax=Ornithorhynchus anatinus TaxID=9258 RepID=F7AYP1_ORNAN|nr:hydroxycarboxylic acid receptor 1 [Ornithorhynchus anatinus]